MNGSPESDNVKVGYANEMVQIKLRRHISSFINIQETANDRNGVNSVEK